jgi:CHAT domain-containing protein
VGRKSPHAEQLRRLVWEPIAKHLAPDTETVYVAPEGALSTLPWAALPGSRRSTVLLEDYTFAIVPHGQFLYEHLSRPPGATYPVGALLALGGVSYGVSPDPVAVPAANRIARRADRGDAAGTWPELPGTAREAAQVARLARQLPKPPEVLERSGPAASTGQLLLNLPKARWAHLATHGYLAAPDSDARKHLYEQRDFAFGVGLERRGAAARHPLTQIGLVLAGANRPRTGADDDGGILTAEAIAGLNLEGMDLTVLSACETGLGEALAPGEGVFGLQRAFHLAGAHNVVASLWRVDDEATAALMALFYHHLWDEGQPPLQALRNAQLELYRHPHEAAGLAKGRGVDFDQAVKRVRKPAAAGVKPAGPARVKDWAAFVLSGPGR